MTPWNPGQMLQTTIGNARTVKSSKGDLKLISGQPQCSRFYRIVGINLFVVWRRWFFIHSYPWPHHLPLTNNWLLYSQQFLLLILKHYRPHVIRLFDIKQYILSKNFWYIISFIWIFLYKCITWVRLCNYMDIFEIHNTFKKKYFCHD